MFHEAFYPRRRHKCSISGVIVLDYKFESTGDLTFILERAVGKGWEFAEWGGGATGIQGEISGRTVSEVSVMYAIEGDTH